MYMSTIKISRTILSLVIIISYVAILVQVLANG